MGDLAVFISGTYATLSLLIIPVMRAPMRLARRPAARIAYTKVPVIRGVGIDMMKVYYSLGSLFTNGVRLIDDGGSKTMRCVALLLCLLWSC